MNTNPLSCRIPRMLLVALWAATGCVERLGPVQVEPEAVVAEAEAAHLLVGRTSLALEHTVFEPCAAELVDVSGQVRLGVMARALDADRYHLAWMVQATDLLGRAQNGEGLYRWTGAVRGQATLDRRDRAITTADFLSIALASPGVDVHRPHVAPRMEVTLSVPVPVQGQLDGVEVEAVGFGQTCDP